MPQADLSNMGAIFKPLIEKAMKAAGGSKPADGKTKRKAEVKVKMKAAAKVKRG
jgi:hypothetical protein